MPGPIASMEGWPAAAASVSWKDASVHNPLRLDLEREEESERLRCDLKGVPAYQQLRRADLQRDRGIANHEAAGHREPAAIR